MTTYRRSRLERWLWPVSHHLITNLTVTVGYALFHVLNRTTVLGRENVPHAPNTLLLSNHQSGLDPFLVGLSAFYPECIFRTSLLPWNPAAEEFFFKTPVLAWLSDNWKCIPIKKGRRDVGAIYRLARALESAPLVMFPEGRRTRGDRLAKARGGAGWLILETRPTVIPVYVDGSNRVLPIGSRFPRFRRRVYVAYGEPMEFSAELEHDKKTALRISQQVMDAIRALRAEVEERKRASKSTRGFPPPAPNGDKA